MNKLVKQAEKIRKDEKVSVYDFIKDLRVSISTYYKWLSMDRDPNNKNLADIKQWIIKSGHIPRG